MTLAEAAVSSITQKTTPGTCDNTELMRVRAHLENRLPLGIENIPAVMAGFACWAVARDVLSWNHRPEANRGATEREISPDEWDPSFFASLAITGEATWEGAGKSDIRREFWYWYLTSAVPEAFAEAVGPPSSQMPLF
jgi:hypothetical protein